MTARVCWLGVGRVLACLLALAVMLPAGGCSAKTAKKKSKAAAAEVPAIDPSTAFAIDEGRIAVSSPTGWTRLPRQKDCLVKYQPGPKNLPKPSRPRRSRQRTPTSRVAFRLPQ